MDRQTFSEGMIKLQMIFGKIEKEKFELYYLFLNEMKTDDFKRAVHGLLAGFVATAATPFPVIAQFLKYSGKDTAAEVQDYIGMIRETARRKGAYYSVDFGCPALHSVLRRWGGWVAVSAWGQEEWDINEGRFREALDAAIRRGDGEEYAKGLHEIENGFLKPENFICAKKEYGKLVFENTIKQLEEAK